MPTKQKKYIKKWKRILNDYSFIEWNEDNICEFETNSFFINDAINQKKYAFISDWVRLNAVFKYGGIYLDTDVELLKSFNPLLNNKLFLDHIVDCSVSIGAFGAEKEHPELLKWLKYTEDKYGKNKKFEANNHTLTEYFLKNYPDFVLNGQKQDLNCGITIYPKVYFNSGKPFWIRDGGYAIHHCAGSWLDKKRENNTIKNIIKKILLLLTPKFVLKIRNYYQHKKENKKYPFYFLYKKNCKCDIHKKQDT